MRGTDGYNESLFSAVRLEAVRVVDYGDGQTVEVSRQ